MRFFANARGHTTANPQQNCFQNYGDHLKSNAKNAMEVFDKLQGPNTFSVLVGETMKRVKIFEALRDGHDYADEVLGAAFGGAILTGAACGMLAMALWELGCSLTMKMGVVKDDGQSHLMKAGKYLLCAIAAYVLSAFIYLKSLISMVTRPIVTLIMGYKPRDMTERFVDNSDRVDPLIEPAFG